MCLQNAVLIPAQRKQVNYYRFFICYALLKIYFNLYTITERIGLQTEKMRSFFDSAGIDKNRFLTPAFRSMTIRF